MPIYLTQIEGWKALWPMPAAAFVLAAVLYALIRPREHRLELAVMVAAFAMLGIVTGYLTGFSRSPAVGAVVPAALSLVGGLAVFLVGRDRTARIGVSLSILGFTTSLALGATWGAIMRDAAEQYAGSEEARKASALREVEVREFRTALGLPAEEPGRTPPGDAPEP